jgi:hypothetical protein
MGVGTGRHAFFAGQAAPCASLTRRRWAWEAPILRERGCVARPKRSDGRGDRQARLFAGQAAPCASLTRRRWAREAPILRERGGSDISERAPSRPSDLARLVQVTPRRGGRVVDCTGLENRSRGNPTQGSNPCLSACGLVALCAPLCRECADYGGGLKPTGRGEKFRNY